MIFALRAIMNAWVHFVDIKLQAAIQRGLKHDEEGWNVGTTCVAENGYPGTLHSCRNPSGGPSRGTMPARL